MERFGEKPPESKVETEKKPEQRIADAKDLDSLYDTIKRKGGLKGSGDKLYSAEELIKTMNMVRENLKDVKLEQMEEITESSQLLDRITTTAELRKTFLELLKKEKKEEISKLGEGVLGLMDESDAEKAA